MNLDGIFARCRQSRNQACPTNPLAPVTSTVLAIDPRRLDEDRASLTATQPSKQLPGQWQVMKAVGVPGVKFARSHSIGSELRVEKL